MIHTFPPSRVQRSLKTWSRRFALAALAGVTLFGLAGCSWLHPEPGGVLTATSTDGARSLAPTFTTAAYASQDADTADVYMSDRASG